MVHLGSFTDLSKTFRRPEVKSKAISALVLPCSFYTFQLLSQRIWMAAKFHCAMPRLFTFPFGLITVSTNLLLAQAVEYYVRSKTRNYTQLDKLTETKVQFKINKSFLQDQISRLFLGLSMFALLEQSLFRTALPSRCLC